MSLCNLTTSRLLKCFRGLDSMLQPRGCRTLCGLPLLLLSLLFAVCTSAVDEGLIQMTADTNVSVSSVEHLRQLLSDSSSHLSLSIDSDLLVNSTNWPDPLTWPSRSSPASNQILILSGKLLPVMEAASKADNHANSTVRWRLPRFDLSNMQGRLHLTGGAVLVLRDLEISGSNIGTWVDHSTLEFVSESSEATVVLENCLLHNTVCPTTSDLYGGFNALGRAVAYPGGQQIQRLPYDSWCDPDPDAAASGSALPADVEMLVVQGILLGGRANVSDGNVSSGGNVSGGAGAVKTCYAPAVRLMDITFTLPNWGQVGGYTTVLKNTTLLCENSVAPDCTKTNSQRGCYLQLMSGISRGITTQFVLQSTTVRTDAQDTAVKAASGGDHESNGWLAAAIGGSVGGAVVAVVLLVGFAMVLAKRRDTNGPPSIGCKFVDTLCGKLIADVESHGSCGTTADGCMIGPKHRTSSQPSSTESNTVTADSTSTAQSAHAANGSSTGPAGAGLGVGGLLEMQRQLHAPTDIRLSVLLGAGSFGRVYSGLWRTRPCAVKILTHGPQETAVIEREVQVSMACHHPNVVETLHFVRLDVTGAAARLQFAAGGKRSGANTSGDNSAVGGRGESEVDLFPTPGQPKANCLSGVYETWLIQELCDGGALSSALYGGRLEPPAASGRGVGGGGGGCPHGRVDLAVIAALALDISRGMSYLHSRGIVHGDLKAENVLLLSCKSSSTERPEASLNSHNSRDGISNTVRTTDNEQPPSGPSGTLQPVADKDADIKSAATAATDDEVTSPATGAAAAATTPPHHHHHHRTGVGHGDHHHSGSGSRYRYVAKVADFGLSRALDPGRTHQTTRNVGTITHMPPESLLGGQIRLATDVFAFGILLWELYTGSRPYTGLTAGEVVHRVVAEGSRPAFPRSTPPAWRALAADCWAQRPEQRPTFEQVEQRLRILLQNAESPVLVGGFDVARPMPNVAVGAQLQPAQEVSGSSGKSYRPPKPVT